MAKNANKPEKNVRLTIKIQNDALGDATDEDYSFDYTDEEYENWIKTGKRTSKSSGVSNRTPLDIDEDGKFVLGDERSADDPMREIKELLTIENTECDDETAVSVEQNNSSPLFVTEGTIREYRGHIEIMYNESDFTDMPDEITTLSFATNEPSIVTMGRNGACTTVMAFEAGNTYKSVYSAFGANFDVDITTYELSNTVTYEDGGELMLNYSITSGGSLVSSTVMHITIENCD